MTRLRINAKALGHNFRQIDRWMKDHGAEWTFVTKAFCGHSGILNQIPKIGVHSIADSRLQNLRNFQNAQNEGNSQDDARSVDTWYLRLPVPSEIEETVALSHGSLNSEISIIRQLNDAAEKHGCVHKIIIMIELGDLREGILPGSLTQFYEKVFNLPHIEVVGIGSQFGCLSGGVPTIDQMMQLVLYGELLELKFGKKLPYISAGSSVTLPTLLEGNLSKRVNHFRIGESVILGTDILNGGTLPGLKDDVAILEADVAEVKEKSLNPTGEFAEDVAPFPIEGSDDPDPGERGYRAVVTLGQLDTDVSGLTPLEDNYEIAGASSDVMVLNIGKSRKELRIGDTVQFKLNYTAFVRLMSSPYTEVVVEDGLGEATSADSPPNSKAKQIGVSS